MNEIVAAYRKEIVEMIEHITSVQLLEKIYKYVRYIYLK